MLSEEGLDIPESNREIALHLRHIRTVLKENNESLVKLSERLDNLEEGMEQRRFRFQDVLLGSLIFPLVGGMLLFLLTQGPLSQ
jgi:hypothetical protein